MYNFMKANTEELSCSQVALLIILLQDQWKKAKEANAKKPTKNPKEAHD